MSIEPSSDSDRAREEARRRAEEAQRRAEEAARRAEEAQRRAAAEAAEQTLQEYEPPFMDSTFNADSTQRPWQAFSGESPASPALEGPVTYVTQLDDTVARIAERFGVTEEQLLLENPQLADGLAPGEVVTVSFPGLANFDQADLHDALLAGAELAGLPAEWADDPALLAIINHENVRLDPAAQNPSSSAFGLFQMVEDTWNAYVPEMPHHTLDPAWQCAGGMRYIEDVYGTPERALAFREATVAGDVNLAPEDLRGRAQVWIDRGYQGY